MALVDTLPLFVQKPLNLERGSGKLTQKSEDKVIDTKSLSYLPTITPTAISNEVSKEKEVLGPVVVPKISTSSLPSIYGQYEPLSQALENSEVRNPQARAAIIAQMGLERGWKAPEDFNYGNITAGSRWTGNVNVRGDKDGQGNRITQVFRVYNSADEFLGDYIALLKQTYPQAYSELLSDDFDIDRFTSGLIDGKFRYAEDPAYKARVRGVFDSVIKRLTTNE